MPRKIRLIAPESKDCTYFEFVIISLFLVVCTAIAIYLLKVIIVLAMFLLSLPPKIGMAMCWIDRDDSWCREYNEEKEEKRKKELHASCEEKLKTVKYANEDYIKTTYFQKNDKSDTWIEGTPVPYHRKCICDTNVLSNAEPIVYCQDTPISK